MSDEPMPIEQALPWACGYSANPNTQRRREVRALVERIIQLQRSEDNLTAAFAEVADQVCTLSPLCPCDFNPATTDGPSQECPLHGDGVTFVAEVTRLRAVEVEMRELLQDARTHEESTDGT